MKTAFVIDFLLERTAEVFLLEMLLAGQEDADIYCMAHAQGRILGPIERHRIITSPLTRFVQTPAQLKEKAWLLPSSARQLKIDSSVQKLVILSSGWAHTVLSSPHVQRSTWVYGWDNPATKLTGLKRAFSPYHQQVKLQALRLEKHASFSSLALATQLGFPEARVIPAAFKTEEFPFIAEEDHQGIYPHHLVLLDGAPVDLVKEVLALARAQKVSVKCLGQDEAYVAEKAWQDPLVEFIGSHCEATTAAITHGARAVWALAATPFPAQALGAQCCGRPAIVQDTAVNREFLNETGAWFVNSQSSIKELFAEVEASYLQADRKVLRRQGLKWNERLFKSQMKDFAHVGKSTGPSSLLR